jgi:hypothetical protein
LFSGIFFTGFFNSHSVIVRNSRCLPADHPLFSTGHVWCGGGYDDGVR